MHVTSVQRACDNKQKTHRASGIHATRARARAQTCTRTHTRAAPVQQTPRICGDRCVLARRIQAAYTHRSMHAAYMHHTRSIGAAHCMRPISNLHVAPNLSTNTQHLHTTHATRMQHMRGTDALWAQWTCNTRGGSVWSMHHKMPCRLIYLPSSGESRQCHTHMHGHVYSPCV